MFIGSLFVAATSHLHADGMRPWYAFGTDRTRFPFPERMGNFPHTVAEWLGTVAVEKSHIG